MSADKKTIKEKFKEAQANDNSHIMDRMADIAYALTTKMPLFGKVAKKSLDKMDALERTKATSSKLFKPFFPFPKVDKKYTEKEVEEKVEAAVEVK